MDNQQINKELSIYPIWPHIDEIYKTLTGSSSRFLVLTAETGAGKSTILPAGLLFRFQKKILVTEPRRLAVLGASSHVASLIGEEWGNTIGYQIHLDKKISPATKVEFLTEAIMVKKIQEDPSVDEASLIIIDEFHERTIHTDLILAFLQEAMEIRDDLYVIIMSATINTKKLQDFLHCPSLQIPGRNFPVQIEYKNESTVEKSIIANTHKGQTILAFLPSIKTIKKTYETLCEHFNGDSDIDLHLLHSSVSLEEQRAVLKPQNPDQCRIIISSAIAETSLTIPGVSLVIDSGLSRVSRINLHTGMENLITEKETQFSAEQRAGRAGREKEGRCLRLWNKEDKLLQELNPEILRTDLSSLILECAARGITNPSALKWLDSPENSAWQSSQKLLQILGCLDKENHITQNGHITLHLSTNPRLAQIAIQGFNSTTKELSQEAKTLLLKYSQYKDSSKQQKSAFLQDIESRLSKLIKTESQKQQNIPLILTGYPDRLGKKIEQFGQNQTEYQFASGKKAVLKNAAGSLPEWIVCPQILAGNSIGIIFEYEVITSGQIQHYIKKHIKKVCHSFFENGKVQKYEEERLGKIVLKKIKMSTSAEDYKEAWINEVLEKGMQALPLDEKCNSLLTRGRLCGREISSLQEKCHEWLLPFLSNTTTLNATTVNNALYWFLNGSEIDQKAPLSITLENGYKCKVNYTPMPEISIIIQKAFGCTKIPPICGKPVLIKLLSPASRPLQITTDLDGFWHGAWKDVCKEMKGRYPKHDWNYQPLN